MELLSIISTVFSIFGLSTMLNFIVQFFIKRFFDIKDRKEEDVIKRKENDKKLSETQSEQIKELQNALKALEERHMKDMKAIQEYKEEKDKVDAQLLSVLNVLQSSQQAILRDRIHQMYNHYYYDKKYMSINARNVLQNMYEQYHALGGNGVVDQLMEKLAALPTKQVDDD